MVIDKETKDRTVINMSIDFDRFVVLYLVLSRIPCMLIDVGYRDALGNDRTDLESEIRKTNLDVNGNLIGVTDTSTVWMII
jgi:singapore isolate B (sub-type 7) whole genome shotgun sequence assembly, scaffold_7